MYNLLAITIGFEFLVIDILTVIDTLTAFYYKVIQFSQSDTLL